MSRCSSRAAVRGPEFLEDRAVPAIVGALDPSFGGGDGQVTLPGATTDRFDAVALQADGRVVVAGTRNGDFLLARYNPDGSFDTTFNNGLGLVVFDFLGADDEAFGLAVQPDGKIVAAGRGNGDFAVLRRNADGTPDTSFTRDLGGTDTARAVALQPDGHIVVAGGSSATGNFQLIRLNTDLTFDATFGVQAVDFGGTDEAYSVAVYQSGPNAGQIVVAGDTTNQSDFAVARLGAAGGVQSQLSFTFGSTDHGRGVAITPDNKVVVAGYSANSQTASNDFAVARFKDASFTFDDTFNPATGIGTGRRMFDLGPSTDDRASSVVVQPDGKIVAAGTQVNGADDFEVLRVNADGTRDTSFNTGGTFSGENVFSFGGVDAANAMALTPTGRLVMAGSTSGGADGAIARLTASVEEGRNLAVGGPANGTVAVFTPTGTGQYATTPTTLNPFAGQAVVRTAVADVDGDGVQDTVVVTGPGGPTRFAVVSGKDNSTLLVTPTAPFAGSEDFAGGAFVAAADIDNDGRAEIVLTPDQGGGGRVVIFSLLTTGLAVRKNFLVFESTFRGGARAAVGDLNKDGFADVAVAAGFLGGPRVTVVSGSTLLTAANPTLLADFFVFPDDAQTLRNGAYVALGDVDGDGFADVVAGGGPGGAPRVVVLRGDLITAGNFAGAVAFPDGNFFVGGDSTTRGGVRVAAVDVDGDNKADVAVGSGLNLPAKARVYAGKLFTGTGGEPASQQLDVFGGTTLADGVYVG